MLNKCEIIKTLTIIVFFLIIVNGKVLQVINNSKSDTNNKMSINHNLTELWNKLLVKNSNELKSRALIKPNLLKIKTIKVEINGGHHDGNTAIQSNQETSAETLFNTEHNFVNNYNPSYDSLSDDNHQDLCGCSWKSLIRAPGQALQRLGKWGIDSLGLGPLYGSSHFGSQSNQHDYPFSHRSAINKLKSNKN